MSVSRWEMSGLNEDLPALEAAAQDEEPLIAEHARWAIAQIHSRCARCG